MIQSIGQKISESCKQLEKHQDINTASLNNARLGGKFVCKNVINLSRRSLSSSEISLLSKGLKYIPSVNKIEQAKLMRKLEEYGRKLCLMWHLRNDERTFSTDKFRLKYSFNPRNKDTVMENYLSWLEERLLDIGIPSKIYINLTKEERDALYRLRDYSTIFINCGDKGSVVVVWYREDYLKEAYKQLEDKAVYKEVVNDPSVLVNTEIKTLQKNRLLGDLSSDTLTYFFLTTKISLGFVCNLKFISVYIMYQVDELFQTAAFTLKTYLRF